MSNYSNNSLKFWLLDIWDFFRSIRLIRIIRLITFVFTFYILHFTFYIPVNAQCPVCTVAVGGGVLLSRYLGIDDLIVGIWAGGFVITSGFWTSSLIKKAYIKGQGWVITAILWITTVLGLKQAGFIGNPTCKIHGHDKLLTGIIVGSLVFLLAYGTDIVLRKLNKKNPGKAFFPYQRVILPVLLLIIATTIGARICNIKL